MRFQNNNPYDLYLVKMDVIVSLVDAPDHAFAVGHFTETNIPGGGRNITAPVPLRMNFSTAADSKAAVATFLDTCAKDTRIKVTFNAVITGKVMGLGPITLPPRLMTKYVPCPKFLAFTRTAQNLFPFNLVRRNDTKKSTFFSRLLNALPHRKSQTNSTTTNTDEKNAAARPT